MTKKVAVINDLSGFGKCSLTASLPILSVLGTQCCPVPTAVLTGQTGYPYYHCTDLTHTLPNYIDAWSKNQVCFDAIYTGYLTGATQIAPVLDFIKAFYTENTLLFVDPVLGDDGRVYDMFADELLEGMKQLSRQANLITPNLTEACLLTDTDFSEILSCTSLSEVLSFSSDVSQKLRENALVPQDIIITGIKYSDKDHSYICNLVNDSDGIHMSKGTYYGKSYSGTGDIFMSILCGCRLKGIPIRTSIKLAEDFLDLCLKDTIAEQIPRNDGINFEKYLLYLIQEVSAYV